MMPAHKTDRDEKLLPFPPVKSSDSNMVEIKAELRAIRESLQEARSPLITGGEAIREYRRLLQEDQ